jgi:hypothetical protein
VNWKAKLEYEFIQNLKILQSCFEKLGIKRHIEVERLAKVKYQDNLEMIQWMKRFYDCNCGDRGNDYDPIARRGGIEPDYSFADKVVIPKVYNNQGGLAPQDFVQKQQIKKEQAPKGYSKENNAPSRHLKRNSVGNNQPPVMMKKPKEDFERKVNKIRDIVSSSDLNDNDKIKQIQQLLEVQFFKQKGGFQDFTNNLNNQGLEDMREEGIFGKQ